MPFRAESSSFRAYSARKPFPFHVCTMEADGSGNKRLTEKSKKDKTAYRLVQIGPNSICCYFIIWKGYFLETQIKWAGGQLRSLQKNQFLFSAALAVILICSARVITFRILLCESKTMIFPTYLFFLFSTIVNDIK